MCVYVECYAETHRVISMRIASLLKMETDEFLHYKPPFLYDEYTTDKYFE